MDRATAETRQRVHSALSAASEEFVKSAYLEAVMFDARAALSAVRCPVVAVLSDLSRASFSLDELVPNVVPRRILGTSAWIQLDDPAELHAGLEEVIASIESPRPLIA